MDIGLISMVGTVSEILFDNLDYDAIHLWCEEFVHWNYVKHTFDEFGVESNIVENSVKISILKLMEELEKIEYGEPKEVDDDGKPISN